MKGTKSDYRKGYLSKRKFNMADYKHNINVVPDVTKKGTDIYRFKLAKTNVTQKDEIHDVHNYVLDGKTVIYHYSDSVSGICRFVDHGRLNDEVMDSSKN